MYAWCRCYRRWGGMASAALPLVSCFIVSCVAGVCGWLDVAATSLRAAQEQIPWSGSLRTTSLSSNSAVWTACCVCALLCFVCAPQTFP